MQLAHVLSPHHHPLPSCSPPLSHITTLQFVMANITSWFMAVLVLLCDDGSDTM